MSTDDRQGSGKSGTPQRPAQRPAAAVKTAGGAAKPAASKLGTAKPATRPTGAQPGRPGGAPSATATARPAGAQQRPAGAAGAAGAANAARPAGAAGAQRQGLVRPAPKAKVRKARLVVSKVDVWSVLKMAFLLSVALGVITVVASLLLWVIFDLTGLFEQMSSFLGQFLATNGQVFNVKDYVSLGQVTSFAVIVAVLNVILLSALSMIVTFIYNLASSLIGGVSVTLTDD